MQAYQVAGMERMTMVMKDRDPAYLLNTEPRASGDIRRRLLIDAA